jgi:hypothetical protein
VAATNAPSPCRRLALLELRLLVRLGLWIVVQRQLQLGTVGLLG